MSNMLTELGFTPPVLEYERDDPRGYEYGYYTVNVCGQYNDLPIYTIKKYDMNRVFEFSMEIRGDIQFCAWVKNTF